MDNHTVSLQDILALPPEQLAEFAKLAQARADLPPVVRCDITMGEYSGKACPIWNLSAPLLFPGMLVGTEKVTRVVSGTPYRRSVPIGYINGRPIMGGWYVYGFREETVAHVAKAD